MALSDKNIIITPNIGSASDPKIQFSGADASTGAQTITLNVYPTSGGMLSFEGSSGQLFSIANSLTGTIYSVNDISGIPSIEVLDSGLVKLAQYNGTVVIGGSTTDGTAKLQVSGGPSRFGNIYVGYGTYKNSIRPVDDSNMNLDTPSGYTGSGTSLRAPIFYDIDNTGFYINPASSSNLNTVYANFFCGNSGNAYGQYKGYDNNNHFIAIRGVVGGTTSSPSITGGHNTTFVEYAEGNDSTGWFFKTAATGNYDIVSRITRSYSYFESSARSPIFYDSDNTGYYLDPTSTTSLRTVGDWRADSSTWTGEYSGKIQYHSSNWYFQAADQFIWRNSSGTNVVYGDQGGNHWAVASSRSPVFYDSNDTGYYLDPNSTSNSALRMRGGALFGPNPTWGAYLYVGTDGRAGTSATVAVTSGNLHLDAQDGYDIYLNHYNGRWFRAPGWYDNNDSAYYVDPNSTSRMYQINFNNLYYAPDTSYGFIGTSIYVDTINSGYSSDPLEINYVRGSWAGISHDSLRAPIFYDYNDTGYYSDPNSSSRLYQTVTNLSYLGADTNKGYAQGYGTYSSQLHKIARITFDWDSNYNAENHGIFSTNINGSYSDSMSINSYNDINLRIDSNDNDAASYVRFHMHTTGSNQFAYIGYDGGSYLAYFAGSTRSPIFYDSDDTSYYGDFNSTSRLVSLIVGGHGGTAYNTASNGRLYFGTNADNSYSIYTHMEDYNGYYTKLTLDWHTGIKIGAYSTYGGIRFYNNSINSSGSEVFSVAKGDSHVRVNNNLYVASNTYLGNENGDITHVNDTLYVGATDSGDSHFYFGEDSSSWYGSHWYWDSAYAHYWYSRHAGSDSVIMYHDTRNTDRLQMGRNLRFDNYGLGVVGAYSSYRYQGVFAMDMSYVLPSDGTTTGSLYGLAWSHPNAGGVAANLNTHGLLVMENGGFLAAVSGSIRARDDMRAPVFYDSNDTGFYINPADISQMWGIAIRGDAGLSYGTGNQLSLWGVGYTTTSTIGFKSNTAPFTNPTGNGDGYNTYLTMDTEGRGWVFRRGTGGGDFTAAYTAGWILNNGTWQANASMRAPIFYDSDNTGYYLNPNGLSYINQLVLGGGSYFRPNNWVQMDSSYGMYWPNHYGAHIHANDLSTYGSIAIRGAKNGWRGIYFYDGGYTPHLMLDGSGNGGMYYESGGRWASYYNYSMDCWGFGTSSANSAYNIFVGKGIYSGGRVDGTVFYDASNSAYYVDPNSTSTSVNVAGSITAAGNVTAYSDIRVKYDIQPITDAVSKVKQLNGVTFMRTDVKDVRQTGVIAQDVLKVLPEAVRGSEAEHYSVAYGNMVGLLIEAIKEQQAEITELKSLVKQLLAN